MSDKYPGGFVTAGAPAGFSVAVANTSNYLTVTGQPLINVADWTVEFWMYPTQFNNNGGVFGASNGGGTNPKLYFYCSSTNLQLTYYSGGFTTVLTNPTPTLNQWTYVSVSRSSSTGNAYLYYNGVLQQTATTAAITGITSAFTLFSDGEGASAGFYGYMSNARVSNVARYTGTNYTTPTQLFPVSGTQLLTCQSPTIIDNSGNGYTLASTGSPTVSNFTPFAGYTGFNPALGAAAGGVWTIDEAAYYQQNRLWPIYDPYFNSTTLMLHGNGTNGAQNNTFLDSSTNNFTITRNGNTTQGSFTPFSQTGWSNYFSGATTSFLSFPSNSALALGNGAYTVEGWIYQTERASSDALFYSSSYATANADAFIGYIKNNGSISIEKAFSGAVLTTAANAVPLNAWCHIAFVRTSTATNGTSIYVNGVAVATGTDANNWSNFNAPGIGMLSSTAAYAIIGYISNFRLVKGTAVYTSNFTPSTQPLTAIANTSLLTCQGNRFVDASANNFTVTSAGTMAVQAFSPFVPAYITPTTYSNWFNKSTGYLTVPSNAAFNLSTGDFTIECWVWFNTTADTVGGQTVLYGTGTGNPIIYISTNGGTTLAFAQSSSIVASGTIQIGAWNHVAVSRSGSSLRFFVGGILAQTATYSTAIDFGAIYIGSQSSGAAGYIDGAISNFRIVKGTALYTANFTPPTAPLTNITNTSLLTCQSSTFIDNSTNAFTVTAVGGVYPVTSPTPFPAKVDTTTLNSAYSTSLIGGSGYFDGTGDYLSVASGSSLNLGTNNYTMDLWWYPTAFNADGEIFHGTNGTFSFYNSSSGGQVQAYIGTGTGPWNIMSAGVIGTAKLNQWNHLAITRSGSAFATFLNGVLGATATSASSITSNDTFVGARSGGAGIVASCYISNCRILSGTALYTAAFAPPIAPPTPIAGTSELLSFTNGAIFDNTAKNVLETVGTAQISTTQSKWGGSSIYFANGGTDYLINPYVNNPNFSFGGDFTVELWVYPTSTPDAYNCIIGNFSESGTTYGWNLMLTSGQLVHVNVAGTSNNSAQTVPLNTWSHLAITRAGSTVFIFVNGKKDTTTLTTSALAYNPIYPLRIGRQVDTTPRYFFGYMDDIRITKGVARYTTNFTPPTSQLQDQ
jgi:hypothetical protein